MHRLINFSKQMAGRGLALCAAQMLKRAAFSPGAAGVRIVYASESFPFSPRARTVAAGGSVKYKHLREVFGGGALSGHVLYAISSSHSLGMRGILDAAKRKGIPVVWNQNGVWVPSAYGHSVAAAGNAAMARFLHAADYVFYQSDFARRSSNHFLGARAGPWEVLYNAVDTTAFTAGVPPLNRPLTLLAAGSHNDSYRLPLAVQTFLEVRRRSIEARLVIAGRVSPDREKHARGIIAAHGLEGCVDWLGPYLQDEAPAVFRRADVLLHTQYNDVCPSVVLEAMACGLPVVYSKTGGTPELVGEAGIGILSELDWNAPHPPEPVEMASAVAAVASELDRFRALARRRVEAQFDLRHWIGRHREVFFRLARSR